MDDWKSKLQRGATDEAWDLFLHKYRRLVLAAIRHYARDYDGVMEFDNLGKSTGSRAELYEIASGAARVARLVASLASSPGVVAQVGGTTQPLPNGRALIAFGDGGRVEEYDSLGNVVWRIDGNPGYIFRAQRIRSLYQPGAGIAR